MREESKPISAVGPTTRELFAAMAMQGLLANSNRYMFYNGRWADAEVAVACADALLKELSK